jgi:hypothetical protein
MQQRTETLVDERGFELLVAYNIFHRCVNEITSVELVIKGKGIQILPSLNQKQIDHIAQELTPFELEEITEE